MLRKQEDHQPPPIYLPCWKCYGHKLCDQTLPTDIKLEGSWVYHDAKPVYCFILNESIIPAALGQDLECPLHGKIHIVHTAPDLVCWIVKSSSCMVHVYTCKCKYTYMYLHVYMCMCIPSTVYHVCVNCIIHACTCIVYFMHIHVHDT